MFSDLFSILAQQIVFWVGNFWQLYCRKSPPAASCHAQNIARIVNAVHQCHYDCNVWRFSIARNVNNFSFKTLTQLVSQSVSDIVTYWAKKWQYLCCPTLGKIAMIFSSPLSKAAPLCLAKRWISRQLAGDKLSFWESSQTIQCPPTILEEITDFSAKIFFPTPSFMSSWDDNDQMADKPQWGEISAKQQQRVSHRVQNKGLFISRYLPCVRLN